MSLKTNSRALGTVAAIALAATLLGGCSATPTEQPTQEASEEAAFNGLDGAVAEYEAATAEYALPDGYTYPESPFADSTGSYQAGYGATEAVRYWNCAWGRTYLAAQGVDPTAADAALTQFAAIRDTEVYQLYFDPASAYPLFDDAVSKGQLGDPSGVQLLVDGGCAPA